MSGPHEGSCVSAMAEHHVAALAETLTAALAADPFYQAITPNGERRAALIAYFALAVREALTAGEVQVIADGAGVAIWTAPTGSPGAATAAADKHDALAGLLAGTGWDAYESISAFSHRHVAQHVPGAAWYLSILGVDPARQGGGLGGRLLQPTLARLDAQGLSCYLETFNPRSLPFYARHGFNPAATEVEPVTGARYWLLLRRQHP